MATTEKKGLPRLVRALDEHWLLRHGLFWLANTAFLMWLFIVVCRQTADWGLALRDSLLIVVGTQVPAIYALLYGVLPLLWGSTPRRGRFLLLVTLWFWLALGLTFALRFFVLVPLRAGIVSPFPDFHNVLATGSHMPTLLIAGVAACLRVYRQWRQKELANVVLSQENYQAELQLLKAQIHPHFLFNTLNNLYALTLRQSDQAPVVVERLTGLLDFVVKQGSAPSVALADEVALLRNYIALQQLRYGARLTLVFEAEDIPAQGRIAPLLLLPLVENAFKHGSAEQVGQAHIRIALAVEGSRFSCVITNTKNADAAAGSPGIGLRNVRQRLQLLYPQRHQLTIEAHPDTFTVGLLLELPALPAATASEPGRLPTAIPDRLKVRRPEPAHLVLEAASLPRS
ncbi:sensor histidine kinase [Hymenobacter lucidus]|uniref:Histidine kinase n=1 Tax=Hymenobacter lucidus TaxID=2880930 RepID=A0ABS8ATV0_9BACT|nr:histidine kinase [Hymenobacter lucidus]MCB2408796.1 histidine kinase [Hymenobacter lucidus]